MASRKSQSIQRNRIPLYVPALVGDALYLDEWAQGAFMPLDPALHARLYDGWMRLRAA